VADVAPTACIYVLAGTNGAGKSSLAGAMFLAAGVEYFNPDQAAQLIRARHPGASQTDAAKATALTRMLWWATHDGQSYEAALGYAPLPEVAIQSDEAQILKIMVDGKQALPTDIATPAAS